MMEYKGYYSGPIDADPQDGTLSGMVVGLTDVIHFEGRTYAELEKSFREGVDDYLAMCQEDGREPERPYSGKLSLRIPPDLHTRVAARAKMEGVSINALIIRSLEAV